MSPAQLQKLLDSARLSQVEAARQLDIDPRTMRRYIAGELPIPKPVELALRYLERHPADPDTLTEEDHEVIQDALQVIRYHRPGKRKIVIVPMRNGRGEFVEAQFVWKDSPGKLLAGKTTRSAAGDWHMVVK
jgi:hypothetical protein